jgi:GDP-fucose protein O-fucosyltransferase
VHSLIYHLYRHGHAGLSNLIMSVEVAVVLSRLTDRLLVLEGNSSPSGNIVRYGDAVSNKYPSKVTDLIDLGVPWIDAESVKLEAFALHDLCPHPTWDCVFYFPAALSTESEDIRSFAGNRKLFITSGEDLADVPALSVSGGPDHNTLSFYSYFFYLDWGAQSLALDALRKMQPKAPYAGFARRVASDLGAFNAVHVRRGDFKVTEGVTTLVRAPEEVIRALDEQFKREDRLVVLTDEANDPFFDPIKAAFRDYVIIDHHILVNYSSDFLDLPAHDSIALAYISQLVAAESRDFVGSMRSTFTSLIQRTRGNRGKKEVFKFLWNEQPNTGDVKERGRHPVSDIIRLEKGVMVPERDGPYSWNRHHQCLNPAWMREWPESFLDETAMLDRARNRPLARLAAAAESPAAAASADAASVVAPGDGELEFAISFLDHSITASSNRPEAALAIRSLFAMMVSPYPVRSSGELRIEIFGDQVEMLLDGRVISETPPGSSFMRSFYRQVVCQFIEWCPRLAWLHAGAAASSGGAVILPGEWARGKSSLVMELCERGWTFLSDDIVPLDPAKGAVLPFPGTPQIRFNVDKSLHREDMGNVAKSQFALDPAKVATVPQPLTMIVFPYFTLGAVPELSPISHGQALGKLLENCLSFVKNDDVVIHRLCTVVENVPTYNLRFGNAVDAAGLLIHAHDMLLRARRLAEC